MIKRYESPVGWERESADGDMVRVADLAAWLRKEKALVYQTGVLPHTLSNPLNKLAVALGVDLEKEDGK